MEPGKWHPKTVQSWQEVWSMANPNDLFDPMDPRLITDMTRHPSSIGSSSSGGSKDTDKEQTFNSTPTTNTVRSGNEPTIPVYFEEPEQFYQAPEHESGNLPWGFDQGMESNISSQLSYIDSNPGWQNNLNISRACISPHYI
ncbi:hypothetical protein BP6252_06538 [Coleophoma cylindrospora]|uniref:Uncharacterized protein n=1 Tax=Coleophoma cylindrospora TaxID=1849047 RepID=A0A3D8RN76_9HELO|nr:hypothetical protein BP6252_06538 [Coleophoma cylindrospora]